MKAALIEFGLDAWRTVAISFDVAAIILIGTGDVWAWDFVAGYGMLAVAIHWSYRLTRAARNRAIVASRARWTVPFRVPGVGA